VIKPAFNVVSTLHSIYLPVGKILSPSFSLLLLAKTITHPAARSLCGSWESCPVTA